MEKDQANCHHCPVSPQQEKAVVHTYFGLHDESEVNILIQLEGPSFVGEA